LPQPVFCVANFKSNGSPATNYWESEQDGFFKSFDFQLRINGEEFHILKTIESAPGIGAPKESLSLVSGGASAILESSLGITLIWAGDLNKDGYPDLFLTSHNKEVCFEYQLLLSDPKNEVPIKKTSGFYHCWY
jgi:hypothetical protein